MSARTRPSVYPPEPVLSSSLSPLAVNHPRRAESIDKHTETDGREGFLDRHHHLPVLRQGVKYAFRIQRFRHGDIHREAFCWFIVPRRSVGAHQYAVAGSEAGMHDFIAPVSGHVFLRRRTRVREHCYDFAAETLLIELECRLALAVERKVSIQLHSALLWLERFFARP